MPFSRGNRSNNYLFWSSTFIVGGGCYAAYVLYNSDYLAEKRKRWDKFYKSITALSDALSSSSDISATITADLRRFLLSDSEDVPQSIRQVLKLSRCAEFQVAVTRVSGALTQGIVKGISATTLDLRSAALGVAALQVDGLPKVTQVELSTGCIPCSRETLAERLLDKVFSEPGKGFAAAVVGKAVRSLVHAYFDYAGKVPRHAKGSGQGSGGVGQDGIQEWEKKCLELAASEKGKDLISLVVSSFAVSAVSTFLDSTSDINMCDDVVSSLTKEEHKEPMTDILKSVCKEAVQSFVRTSHAVLTEDTQPAQESSSQAGPSSRFRAEPSFGQEGPSASSSTTDVRDAGTGKGASKGLAEPPPPSGKRATEQSVQRKDWQSEVAILMAKPETRQLVVDVAGVMSSEGVRAFTEVCMGMLGTMGGSKALEQADGLNRGGSRLGVFAPLRAVAAKALTASSVCLALCLHMVTGTASAPVSAGRLTNYSSH